MSEEKFNQLIASLGLSLGVVVLGANIILNYIPMQSASVIALYFMCSSLVALLRLYVKGISTPDVAPLFFFAGCLSLIFLVFMLAFGHGELVSHPLGFAIVEIASPLIIAGYVIRYRKIQQKMRQLT